MYRNIEVWVEETHLMMTAMYNCLMTHCYPFTGLHICIHRSLLCHWILCHWIFPRLIPSPPTWQLPTPRYAMILVNMQWHSRELCIYIWRPIQGEPCVIKQVYMGVLYKRMRLLYPCLNVPIHGSLLLTNEKSLVTHGSPFHKNS